MSKLQNGNSRCTLHLSLPPTTPHSSPHWISGKDPERSLIISIYINKLLRYYTAIGHSTAVAYTTKISVTGSHTRNNVAHEVTSDMKDTLFQHQEIYTTSLCSEMQRDVPQLGLEPATQNQQLANLTNCPITI